MPLRYAHEYFCTEEGIFDHFHALRWQRWRLRVREETVCYCRWEEITLVEGAKDERGGRTHDVTYYFFVHARGRILKAQDDDNGLTRFANVRDGISRYLVGFRLDWRQRLDRHFAEYAYPQNEGRISLYRRLGVD